MAESNPRFLRNPIAVVDYDVAWPDEFARERQRILELVGAYIVELEHYGSTAIPGLAAKPIIDMLAGVQDVDEAPVAARSLLDIGYADFGVQVLGRRLFTRGGRANEATHHLAFRRLPLTCLVRATAVSGQTAWRPNPGATVRPSQTRACGQIRARRARIQQRQV
jgi:GrpB-like predicted nucleotidyltransferase (UPF0157 family)